MVSVAAPYRSPPGHFQGQQRGITLFLWLLQAIIAPLLPFPQCTSSSSYRGSNGEVPGAGDAVVPWEHSVQVLPKEVPQHAAQQR